MADEIEVPVTGTDLLVDDDGNIIGGELPSESSAPETPSASTPDESQDDSNQSPETPLDDDDDEAEDHPLPENATEAEREEVRERRRQERKDRKQRQREREQTLRAQLEQAQARLLEQESRLSVIERRNTGSEMAQISTAKTQAVGAYNHFKQQVKLAAEANDGAALTDSMEKMTLAQRRFEELDRLEKAYTARQNTPPPLDPMLKDNAEKWMSKHTWYNPQGADDDSAVMLAVDQRMAQGGWDPRNPQYWEELTRRGQRYLPHRFQGNQRVAPTNTNQPRPKPRSTVPPAGGPSNEGGSSSGGFRLSAERIQAMKDSGNWNDPDKRKAMIQEYKNYDAQHKND